MARKTYYRNVFKTKNCKECDFHIKKCIYHSTAKMKPVDVKPSTYIESGQKINYQDPKFKIGDIVSISEY